MGVVSKEDLIGIEKADLHAHLNGSIPPAFLFEVAVKKGIFKEEERARLTRPPQGWDNCFELFQLVYKLIRGHELFYRVTQEAILDFAKQGVSYLELRTTLKSDQEAGVTWRSYMETLLKATDDLLATSEKGLPAVNWIISIDRSKGVAMASEVIDLALELREEHRRMVGIDFCGDPFQDHFENYVGAFERARRGGLKTTFHFAEVPDGKDLHEMLDFGPDRIGHACNVPTQVMERILDLKVPVEICFSSNLATGVVAEEQDHSVVEFFNADHPIAICTDDFGIFHSDSNDEHLKVAKLLGLDLGQIEVLCSRAFEMHF